MISLLLRSSGMRSGTLFFLTLLLAACTTTPITPQDEAGAGLTPKRVYTYVGNSSTQAYARSTIGSVLGEPARSLNRSVTADTNVLEFKDVKLIKLLQQKWASAKKDGFTVAHFGDSLVQGGYAAELTRSRLQSIGGSAGRGMVFPYAIANTYSQNDFRSTFTGEWLTANSSQLAPNLALGVSGFVARTAAVDASFTLNFFTTPEPGKKRVKLFYIATSDTYTLRVQSGNFVHDILVRGGNATPKTQMLEMNFPELSDTLRFEILNTRSKSDSFFEVHGVSIENTTLGVLYHNLGVGSATYGALLGQKYFEEQSAQIAPDLIVLDWGTNDLAAYNSITPEIERNIVQTIQRVKAKHPKAVIVVTSAQDFSVRGKNITSTFDFAALTRRLAFENDCLFYDWYRVAGGRGAMKVWTAYGLASPDNVHLTGLGYAVKGELFAQSLLSTLERFKNEPSMKTLEVTTTPSIQSHSVVGWLKELSPAPRKGLFTQRP
jgi:lysophospholipase L1-like esterase